MSVFMSELQGLDDRLDHRLGPSFVGSIMSPATSGRCDAGHTSARASGKFRTIQVEAKGLAASAGARAGQFVSTGRAKIIRHRLQATEMQ
jgi:hypothetical protein